MIVTPQMALQGWVKGAERGDRLIIIAEADGSGDAIWGSFICSRLLVEDAEVWKTTVPAYMEEVLRTQKERLNGGDHGPTRR